ncbi:uncharacterized protein LOC131882502 [Tigriopus californicus]|uniref:uncharacterized protein LOC131882502 n=1 Tax=Tigriopus californicus TaxID=6832 RepID=UPI0027DA37A1|nr:uncharacterized protein LOC131882502 [Tigriopus californicus]
MAGGQGNKVRQAFQMEAEIDKAMNTDGPNHVSIQRLGGAYSKQARLRASHHGDRSKEGQNCGYCGGRHSPGRKKCPAGRATCSKCSKPGHFATVCRSMCPPGAVSARSVNRTDAEPGGDQSDKSTVMFYNILAVTSNRERTNAPPALSAILEVGEAQLQAIVDTGAQANVAPLRLIGAFNEKALKHTTITVRPFGSEEITPCGILQTDTSWQGATISAKWIIIDDSLLPRKIDPIISRSLAQSLGLATLHPNLIPFVRSPPSASYKKTPSYLHPIYTGLRPGPTQAGGVNQGGKQLDQGTQVFMSNPRFKDCFKGLGCLKDHHVRLYLKPEAKPFVAPPKVHAFFLQPQVDQTIKEMLANGVIEPHWGPADWVANLAIAFKDDGALRVTVDLRGLNREIRDTRVPIPTPDSIKAKLAGCRVFSKLDFTQSFHQLQLHPESRALTVFRSVGRLYRYTRVSMGLKPASGAPAAACQKTFGHLDHVHTIHDDVIIAAPSKQQHDKAITEFMEAVRKSGMTLNPAKCTIGAKEIAFWGVRVSEWGISPDPEKTRTLREAKAPTSKQDLVSFLCMARSHQDFIPSVAGKTPHLRALTKKHVPFRWDRPHQREFEALRGALCEDIRLTFFDTRLKTHLIVDAHSQGLGGILAQGDTVQTAKPVAMASSSTSPTEKKYPQLDLEALGVDFCLRRFRPYLLGNPHVIIHTDHKPLASVFRDTRLGSIRTDRIKLRHQDIQYQVQHLKGADNPADYLSRNPTPWTSLSREVQSEADESEKLLYHLHCTDIIPALGPNRVAEAASRCPETAALRAHLESGTIPNKGDPLRHYKPIFRELTISSQGSVLRGERLVVSMPLRSELVALA